MSTENIDVVINPGTGARRVVRDFGDIAGAADNAGNRIANLQRQINMLGGGTGLSQFQAQLTAVTSQLTSLNQQLQQMHTGVGRMSTAGVGGFGAMRTAIVGMMSVMSVKTLMDWTDGWIALEGKIRTLAPTLADAALVMEKLFKIAQETRAPVEKLGQIFHFMTISSKSLGASQQDMLRVTENVAKVLAVQGTSFQQARGSLLQLAQAFGTNLVRGQEFNSMLQNVPLLLKIAANHVKGAEGDVGKLRNMMLKGKLTSKEFFDAILQGSKEIDEYFTQAPKTFSQGLVVMKNAIQKYLGEVNQASSVSKIFYEVMARLSENIDNVVKSLLVVGAVLIALPLGPIGVAIAALGTYMYFFAEKTLIAKDGVTTLADVGNVVWEDMRDGMVSVQKVMQEFGQKYLPDVSKSFADLGNITFMDLIKAGDQLFDKLLQAAVGGAYGIKEAFLGLPNVVDEVGKRMFNALVGWIEKIINTTIDGINKVAKFVGQDLLSHVTFEKARVDEAAFRKYGQNVSNAVALGVKAAGNPFENSFNSMIDRATVRGIARAHDAFRKAEITDQNANLLARGPMSKDPTAGKNKGASEALRNEMRQMQEIFDRYKQQSQSMVEQELHKEIMLKASYDAGAMNFREYMTSLERMQDESFQKQQELLNNTKLQLEKQYDAVYGAMRRKGAKPEALENFAQDFLTKIKTIDDALDKLKNKQEETLAQRIAGKVKPINDFVSNMEKAIALDDINLKQELDKVAAKKNVNQLDERSLFIYQEIIRLQAPYENAMAAANEQLRLAKEAGLFEIDDVDIQRSLNNLLTFADKLKGKIDEIKETAPAVLGQAFDAGKVEAFSKNVSKGLAEALIEGGKEGAKGVRNVLQQELFKKPIVALLEGVLKPIAGGIGAVIMGVLGGSAGSSGSSDSAVQTIMRMFTGGSDSADGGGAGSGGFNFASLFSGGSNLSDSIFNTGRDLWANNDGAMGQVGSFMVDNADTIGTVASGLGYFSAINSASEGKWGTAVGQAIGTYILPGIGTAIGGAIGGMVDEYFGGGGGPKTESGAGTYAATAARYGADPALATSIVDNIGKQWKSVAQQFGIQARDLGLGAWVSQDPQGDAMTQLDVVSNTIGYSRGSRMGTTENVGRSEAELQAAISAETTRVLLMALQGSNLSDKLMSAIKQIDLSSTAEVLQEKLGQIIVAKQVEDSMMGLGQAFQFVAAMSVDATNRMVEFGGGIQSFTAGFNAYLKGFFTPEEQRSQMAGQVAGSLNKDLGINLTNSDILNWTNQGFRQWVQTLDMTSDWGQAAFGAAMKVAGAMAELTKETDKATVAVETQAVFQADLQKINTLRGQLTQAYQAERSEIEQMIDSLNAWRDKMVNFRAGLVQGSDSPYTPLEKYNLATTDYNKVSADLMSNDPATRAGAQDRFDSVANAFLEASKVSNASSQVYQADFARVLADSLASENAVGGQIDTATAQLTALEQSVQYLIDLNANVVSVRDAIFALTNTPGSSLNPAGTISQLYQSILGRAPEAGAIEYGTAQLNSGASQSDIAIGMLNSTEAMNTLGPEGIISSLYRNVLGREAEPAGMQYWMQQFASGMPISSIADGFKQSQEYQTLAGHAGGLSYVPRNDYFFRAHYGEAILSTPQANLWRAGAVGGMDLGAVTSGLANVHGELMQMREQQVSATRAEIASNEMALEKNSKDVGARVSDVAGRDSFKSRARQRHRIA